MTRVGFLGPHGTFAEEAVLTQPDLADQELQPRRSVPDVISAIERDEVDIGLVPIENSIEGSITVTLDTLAFGSFVELEGPLEVLPEKARSLDFDPKNALKDSYSVLARKHLQTAKRPTAKTA